MARPAKTAVVKNMERIMTLARGSEGWIAKERLLDCERDKKSEATMGKRSVVEAKNSISLEAGQWRSRYQEFDMQREG